MKSFAQLKRDLKPGVYVKTVLNTCKPEKNGEIRPVARQQSNAITFQTPAGESYLWWPKANEIEYENNTFKIYHKQTLVFIYEII